MDIGEVAKKSGLSASALRFYEEKGLIASVGRVGLRRTFAPAVMDQLSLIALGRAAGFSLDEVGGMFSAEGHATIDRPSLKAKAEEIDATVRRLQALSNGLRHAAVCPASNHSECPTFQRLLRAAVAGKLTPPPKKMSASSKRVRRGTG